MPTNRRSRPLHRDPDDKMLGGVCSGLGHYFDIDTVLVRVGFVVLALIGGGGALAYAILWVLLDPAPPEAVQLPESADAPSAADTIDTGSSVDDAIEAPIEVDAIETGGRLDDQGEAPIEVVEPDESRTDRP